MALVLDDIPRDPDRLLHHLQQMTEVVTQQNASLISLQAKYDTVLTERDTLRAEHDAAQAEIEKLRLLIRQLQRGQFGRRSERLDPDQLQLGLEDLEQTAAAAEAAQEEEAARSSTPRTPRVRRRNLGALPPGPAQLDRARRLPVRCRSRVPRPASRVPNGGWAGVGGEEVRWVEVFLRGGNAWEAFGRPASGERVEVAVAG